MFVSRSPFLKTYMVDWESKRIQFGSMPSCPHCVVLASMTAYSRVFVVDICVVDSCVSTVAVVALVVLVRVDGDGHASE